MISEQTKKELLTRSGRRCECHRADCRHHRPNNRCPRPIREGAFHVIQREPGAGEKLWNLLAVCKDCHKTAQG